MTGIFFYLKKNLLLINPRKKINSKDQLENPDENTYLDSGKQFCSEKIKNKKDDCHPFN